MYSTDGDEVILRLSESDYHSLLFMLGAYAGAQPSGSIQFLHAMAFVNRLNEGNPNFIPYKLPEVFRKPPGTVQ